MWWLDVVGIEMVDVFVFRDCVRENVFARFLTKKPPSLSKEY
jgi:hypothetical protein